MAARTFTLSIASVSGEHFSGEVSEVLLPGEAGVMQVLAHHEPTITPLKAGVIRYTPAEGERAELSIESGVAEIAHNRCTVLL